MLFLTIAISLAISIVVAIGFAYFTISIFVAVGIVYFGQKNISEKRLLRDKGLEATANIIELEETKGGGRYSNKADCIKLNYTLKPLMAY